MRAVFSLLGLLLVLLVVGGLLKKQFDTATVTPPAAASAAGTGLVSPGTPLTAAQRQLTEQQIKQSIESAMQRSQPLPEEP